MNAPYPLDNGSTRLSLAAVFRTELANSLLACGRVLCSQHFLDYANTVISNRNSAPGLAEKFYKLGIQSLTELLASFLKEAAQRGLIDHNEVERATDQLFWAMCGKLFLSGLFTGELASEHDLRSAAEQTVSAFLDRQ
jgi:hypothetical protein